MTSECLLDELNGTTLLDGAIPAPVRSCRAYNAKRWSIGSPSAPFGEHQWADTGIFEFLRYLPDACFQQGLRLVHPSALVARSPLGALSFPRPTSWADVDRSVTAWLGNGMQWAAHSRLYRLREAIMEAGDAELLHVWRRLTTSDHLYYMCTKWFADGDVHKYFSPYDTPYDAFIVFMNVLQDLEQRIADPVLDRPLTLARPGVAEMACVA